MLNNRTIEQTIPTTTFAPDAGAFYRIAANPAWYKDTPLMRDIEHLCDPASPVSCLGLLNLVAKFFYAYLHEGAETLNIPGSSVMGAFAQFSRHASLNEPGDDIQVMNCMRQWSTALGHLADLAGASHGVRAILDAKLPEDVQGLFVGTDVCAGTGITLLAQYLLARRNGIKHPEIIGFEREKGAGERTSEFLARLGVAHVFVSDPTQLSTYAPLMGKKVTFAAGPNVSAREQRFDRESFFDIYKTFFRALAGGLEGTVFFPEGVIVYSREMNVSLILDKDNAFQPPPEYADLPFHPQGVVWNGDILPLHRLGQGFRSILAAG